MKKLMFIILPVLFCAVIIKIFLPFIQVSDDGYNAKPTQTAAQSVDAAPSVEVEEDNTTAAAAEEETVAAPVAEEAKAVVEEAAAEPMPATEEKAATSELENEDKAALYSVVDGNKLDANSYAGFKLFRNWCARCHGTYGQGMVGPNLADSLKVISEKEFFDTVANGKSGTIGSMPAWKANSKVMEGRDQLYAYLMARADGAIGVVKPKKQQ